MVLGLLQPSVELYICFTISIAVADPKGQKFFIFMQCSGKIDQIIVHASLLD